MNRVRLLLVIAFSLLAALAALAQNDGPGVGQGWLPEFNHSSRQILALADAEGAEFLAVLADFVEAQHLFEFQLRDFLAAGPDDGLPAFMGPGRRRVPSCAVKGQL